MTTQRILMGKAFKHKRFIAIPDYSVINACNHSILCVGGAISIDRTYRLEAWSKEQQKRLRFSNTEVVDDFSPSYYWQSESPTYNKEALMSILSEQKVDIVITHTSPSFCELLSKEDSQMDLQRQNSDIRHTAGT